MLGTMAKRLILSAVDPRRLGFLGASKLLKIKINQNHVLMKKVSAVEVLSKCTNIVTVNKK